MNSPGVANLLAVFFHRLSNNYGSRFLVWGSAAAFLATGSQALSQANSQPKAPDVTWTLQSLANRKQEQIDLAKPLQAFHGFQFKNEIARSGITFRHQIVDDCGKELKAILYDHGTGLTAADIDGDGRIDIFFVNQIGGCELWRNLGDGKFENITASAGVGLPGRVCVGASFADLDNDGLPDLFVTTVKFGNVLFKNLGGGKFKDISKEAGLDFVGHSSAGVMFDFDNDGLLDIFLVNTGTYTTEEKGRGGYYVGVTNVAMGFSMEDRKEPSILYKNLGGMKFKNVSKEMHLQHDLWSGDATFCDVNADGFPDLFVLNMAGGSRYYENQGGKGFVDKTAQYFPKTPSGAMGVKFFDFNQDGLIDLYVTDMHSDMSPPQNIAGERNFRLSFEKSKSEPWCGASWTEEERANALKTLVYGNAFYLNQGAGKYQEVSDQINAETYWPWGLSVGDLNADGFEDVFITSGMGYPFRYSLNNVLLNEGGKRFYDAEFLLGVEPRLNSQIDEVYFTCDCSGEDKKNPLCYHKKGLLPVRGVLSSRSSLMFDVDGDGDLDLVVEDFNDRPQVLISNLTSKKAIHYLKIKLVGTKSNRDGLGATVHVKAGGKTYTQYYDGKSGYFAQSLLPMYFGLGDATRIDSIDVIWPSGTKQVISSGITPNHQMEIKEASN